MDQRGKSMDYREKSIHWFRRLPKNSVFLYPVFFVKTKTILNFILFCVDKKKNSKNTEKSEKKCWK